MNGENKGQINMNPESDKRFVKKKLWEKIFYIARID